MEYTIVRQKNPINDTDHIFIPEIDFHCFATAPTGKYEILQLPCPKCLDITYIFVIETKNGDRLLNFGTKYLSMFCTSCDYSGKLNVDDEEKNPWKSIHK